MIGTSLGPYKIIEQIGAGGMGEVYLGEDTRLGRRVAIKVLPEEYASDPERLARFEQEARAAAALNHPHIAVVHDIGTAGDTHFMVQEYLEGQSLRERLEKGALPLDKALNLAIEVGEALIAAHKAGIIHRDLKPDNIFVTEEGHAKVLDFGLAKLVEMSPVSGSASMSPTMLGTVAGQVMGTAGYMAPEQINGEEVDHRADLFAFGCVLYEMTTGRRAFAGENVHETLSRIISGQPQPVHEVSNSLPPKLEWVLDKALAKDTARRYQGAVDLAVDLRTLAAEVEAGAVARTAETAAASAGDASASSPAETSASIGEQRRGRALSLAPWALTAAFAVVAVYALWWSPGERVATPRPTYLTLDDPPGSTAVEEKEAFIAISPDGRRIVYDRGTSPFFLYDLDRPGSAVPLPGTASAANPFFSPDGRWLGYVVGTGLRRLPMAGGNPELVTTLGSSELFGAFWGQDDRILFVADWSEAVRSVSASGGEAAEFLALDTGKGETAHVWPQELPDGKILFGGWDDEWYVAVFDPETETCTELFRNGHDARYVPTGHIVYGQDNFLFARRFDTETVEVGDPVQLLDTVSFDSGPGRSNYAFSDNGVFTYLTGPSDSERTLLRIDLEGNATPLSERRGRYDSRARISPDGRLVALTVLDPAGGQEVWIHDIERGDFRPIAQDPGWDEYPFWAPDGSIAWTSETLGGADILRRLPAGSAPATPLAVNDAVKFGLSSHADGKFLVRQLGGARNRRGPVGVFPGRSRQPGAFCRHPGKRKHRLVLAGRSPYRLLIRRERHDGGLRAPLSSASRRRLGLDRHRERRHRCAVVGRWKPYFFPSRHTGHSGRRRVRSAVFNISTACSLRRTVPGVGCLARRRVLRRARPHRAAAPRRRPQLVQRAGAPGADGALIGDCAQNLCPRGTNSCQRTPTPAKNRLISTAASRQREPTPANWHQRTPTPANNSVVRDRQDS